METNNGEQKKVLTQEEMNGELQTQIDELEVDLQTQIDELEMKVSDLDIPEIDIEDIEQRLRDVEQYSHENHDDIEQRLRDVEENSHENHDDIEQRLSEAEEFVDGQERFNERINAKIEELMSALKQKDEEILFYKTIVKHLLKGG